jgi:hypothetical protein
LFDSSGNGGSSPATLAVSGGLVDRVQAAIDSNCEFVTGQKFAPDGSVIAAIHSTCIDETKSGVFLHSPQTGEGTLYYANRQLELTKPVFAGNIGLVLGQVGTANGLIVVQDGAMTSSIAAPAGLSFDSMTLSPDGNTLVLGVHDVQSFAKNLYVTQDFQTYTPITTSNIAVSPAF